MMLLWHVLFVFTAIASRHAREGANATVLVSDVRPSEYAKAIAILTRVMVTSSNFAPIEVRAHVSMYMTMTLEIYIIGNDNYLVACSIVFGTFPVYSGIVIAFVLPMEKIHKTWYYFRLWG